MQCRLNGFAPETMTLAMTAQNFAAFDMVGLYSLRFCAAIVGATFRIWLALIYQSPLQFIRYHSFAV